MAKKKQVEEGAESVLAEREALKKERAELARWKESTKEMIQDELVKFVAKVREDVKDMVHGNMDLQQQVWKVVNSKTAQSWSWRIVPPILATLAACVLVFFAVKTLRSEEKARVEQVLTRLGQTTPVPFVSPLSVSPSEADSTPIISSATTAPLSMIKVIAEKKCWVRVQRTPPSDSILFEKMMEPQEERHFWGGSLLRVRSGCPGDLRYFVNGAEVHPANRTEHSPPLVELVELP